MSPTVLGSCLEHAVPVLTCAGCVQEGGAGWIRVCSCFWIFGLASMMVKELSVAHVNLNLALEFQTRIHVPIIQKYCVYKFIFIYVLLYISLDFTYTCTCMPVHWNGILTLAHECMRCMCATCNQCNRLACGPWSRNPEPYTHVLSNIYWHKHTLVQTFRKSEDILNTLVFARKALLLTLFCILLAWAQPSKMMWCVPKIHSECASKRADIAELLRSSWQHVHIQKRCTKTTSVWQFYLSCWILFFPVNLPRPASQIM